MRVLMVAYACQVGEGSEPGAGYATVLAAAEEHDVWLVTRTNNLPRLERAIKVHPLGSRVCLVGFDLGERWLGVKRRMGRLGTHLYYDAWQRGVVGLLVELDRHHDFDLVHHATFATHWTRIGAARVDKPLVVGPTGGSIVAPLRLWPTLGWRGVIADIGRRLLRPVVARVTGSRAAVIGAAAVLLQNPATLAGVIDETRSRVLPNGLVGALTVAGVPAVARSPRVAFVGRLVRWKGARLAVRMMEYLTETDLVLDVYGDGPERVPLERYARRRSIAERVVFHGQVPRKAVLRAVAGAAALIHPAVNEESSVTVGEALTLGTPVVCLDHGGPPALIAYWPGVPSRKVIPRWPAPTARGLAAAVLEVAGHAVPADGGPGRSFVDGVLAAYRMAATAI